ncbi:MAG: serine hydrolase [Acidobacteria bacterium]|nr:serine hydrolase [Acidobacteriota bacterium]
MGVKSSASALLAWPFVVVLAACAPATTGTRVTPGHPPADPAARALDATLSPVYAPDGPGASVIVVKEGRVVFRKAYGLANVELNVPMRPEHVLALASLTKQFTAAGILKLAEDGKLSVNDDITRFLPDYPTHGAAITIEHLLTHTSGLSSLSETSDLRAVAAQEGKLIDVLPDWVKDLPPDAAPGETWAYSNWGYNLLGAIIEQASGLSYGEYLQQRIFAPLGMTHTYYTDRRRLIPARATGYEKQGDAVVNILPSRGRIFHPGGAGGLSSTVDDLATWDAALAGGSVLSKASTDRMFTSYRLKDGTVTNYGYGWDLGTYAGHVVQEHAGGTTGFQSYIVRVPDAQVFVAILSNQASPSAPMQTTAHRVAAIALGQPIVDPAPVAVAPESLERLVGTYRGSDVGTVNIVREGGQLFAQVGGLGKMPLTASGPLTFHSSSVLWSWEFEPGADGRAARVRVRDWKLNDLAERVVPTAPVVRPVVAVDAALLDACAGEYESLNGILVKVVRSGDHLAVTPTAQPGVEVFPVSPTEFVTRDAGVQYSFVADPAGKIGRCLRSAGGGRPVPARRIL